ncbi:fimbrial protein [Kosakonia sacchari]|uniref:fimbrial protein n=1 Tax=Kosakonia sacchari TaxID=1158459 RepID=UPI002ACEE48B|nr:fimbrial protein [Kosakonia sacchari]MDZ7320056.1 fimbrial protein [Kosakonia sacchari]
MYNLSVFKKQSIMSLLFIFSMIVTSHTTSAEEPKNIIFTGTLIDPPQCSINEGGAIYVDFGDKISTSKVETGRYRKFIDIRIDCGSNTTTGQIALAWRGNMAYFDDENATIATREYADLGVKLFIHEKPFVQGSPLVIEDSQLLQIEAVLVQAEGASLEEGPFTAQATLWADYQ